MTLDSAAITDNRHALSSPTQIHPNTTKANPESLIVLPENVCFDEMFDLVSKLIFTDVSIGRQMSPIEGVTFYK